MTLFIANLLAWYCKRKHLPAS